MFQKFSGEFVVDIPPDFFSWNCSDNCSHALQNCFQLFCNNKFYLKLDLKSLLGFIWKLKNLSDVLLDILAKVSPKTLLGLLRRNLSSRIFFLLNKNPVNFPDVLPVLHILENTFERSSRISFTSSFFYIFYRCSPENFANISMTIFKKKILGNSSRRILKEFSRGSSGILPYVSLIIFLETPPEFFKEHFREILYCFFFHRKFSQKNLPYFFKCSDKNSDTWK